MKQIVTTLNEFPLPDSLPFELQVIADIISTPDTLLEAEKMLKNEMFSDERCKQAYETLKNMAKEGMVIDFSSAFLRVDRDLMRNGVAQMLSTSGGHLTSVQHFQALKEIHIKRRCYSEALKLLVSAAESTKSAKDLIGQSVGFAESIKKELGEDRNTQHISEVMNDLGGQIEELQKNRAEGKVLRVPTGFSTLDYLTLGGFNAGNLVILAARPSVGKTAIMLQMVRAAAMAGKSVNLFNLEMTNTELAQRLVVSTSLVRPSEIARGDVNWEAFEYASAQFTSKPIFLNDVAHTFDEIRSQISMNSMAGKCDIAFIDYLGLIQLDTRGNTLAQAIAECTKGLKNLAKECKIPIVLLCQLNRASASEKRAPELYDLRDSGSIEQDADIVLMLEKAKDEMGNDAGTNIWVRKNRQHKAGDVVIETQPNETYTVFVEKNYPPPPEEYITSSGNDFNNNFDDNSDIPF